MPHAPLLKGAVLALAVAANARAAAPSPIVATLAGTGARGFADGAAAAATFAAPGGVAYAPRSGRLFVADAGNNVIRTVVAGAAATLAGSGAAALVDGVPTAAAFSAPAGLAIDATESFLFVADAGNHAVRIIVFNNSVALLVSTQAGGAGAGFSDGIGTLARFSSPRGIAVQSVVAYVADTGNHALRLVNDFGRTTTIAGVPGVPGFVDGALFVGRLSSPAAVAIDDSGLLFVADTGNNAVRVCAVGGNLSTLAGGGPAAAGFANGAGTAARFDAPLGVAAPANSFSSSVVVADSANARIRLISPSGVVSSLAGSGAPAPFADGPAANATFSATLQGVAIGINDTVYAGDAGNERVRVVSQFEPPASASPSPPPAAPSAAPNATASAAPANSTLTASPSAAAASASASASASGGNATAPAAAPAPAAGPSAALIGGAVGGGIAALAAASAAAWWLRRGAATAAPAFAAAGDVDPRWRVPGAAAAAPAYAAPGDAAFAARGDAAYETDAGARVTRNPARADAAKDWGGEAGARLQL